MTLKIMVTNEKPQHEISEIIPVLLFIRFWGSVNSLSDLSPCKFSSDAISDVWLQLFLSFWFATKTTKAFIVKPHLFVDVVFDDFSCFGFFRS